MTKPHIRRNYEKKTGPASPEIGAPTVQYSKSHSSGGKKKRNRSGLIREVQVHGKGKPDLQVVR